MIDSLLIPSLTFIAVMSIGAAVITGRAARRQVLRDRLDNLDVIGETNLDQKKDGLVSVLHRMGAVVASKNSSASLRADLAKAGYHHRSAGEVYLGIKMFLMLVGLIAGTIAAMTWTTTLPMAMFVILGTAATCSFLPNLVVTARRQKRCTSIRQAMPDAIDLLEICVSSGMGLDMAWNSVAHEIRRVSPILADEMALTNLEIHLGADRADAMRHTSDRTGADEMASLASVLVQSERFGTSIADALRTYATSMREQRSLRAEEAAEKMAVKLLIPMVVFIFPTILVVTAGPAGVKLTALFGS